MKEQFVPYEIAKQLKQKGFNEYCLGLYQKNKKLIYAKPNNVWNNFWTDDELTGKITKPGNLTSTWKQEEIDEERKKGNTFESCVGYAAPLWQQVEDWLFDKGFRVMDTYYLNKKDWGYMVFPNSLSGKEFMLYMKDHDNKTHFKTKYEALQAAIEHALTLI